LKRIAFSLLVAGFLGGCAPRAAPPLEPRAPAISPAAAAAATSYVQTALSSGQFEMQSGELALQMTQSPALRALAQNLVNDHAQLAGQINAAAQSAGIAAPQVVMLAQHSAQLSKLQYARGSEFENNWRSIQVASLTQALDAHQRYATSGEVPALRSAAASAAAMVQSRLSGADLSQPGRARMIKGEAKGRSVGREGAGAFSRKAVEAFIDKKRWRSTTI
jgi:putative membrane protein